MTIQPVRHSFAVAACALSLLAACSVSAQEPEENQSPLAGMDVRQGPGTLRLGSIAEVKLPGECIYLNGTDTSKLMKQEGNPSDGAELGSVIGENCIAVFEFDPVGYVKDDEKDELDPDELMDSIREGTKEANKERANMGVAPMHIKGWYKKPYYDEATHNLEWIIIGESEGVENLNVNTRILGRKGVMTVTLITSPQTIARDLAVYRDWLKGFDFQPGQKYGEYRAGDKVAEYGLMALVAGGGAAMLAKGGFFKSFWKLIVAGLAAAGAFIKKFFRKKQS